MNNFANMPVAGLAVIALIAVLFILALLLLFLTYARYKHLASMVNGNLNKDNSFLRFVVNDFAEAYKKYGQEVNTPAIIANGVNTKLSGMLLCERFLNNAVSLLHPRPFRHFPWPEPLRQLPDRAYKLHQHFRVALCP